MTSHGQFCSIARALELLGERWTLLVVRELLSGSRRFAEIRRGIPRISKTMLSARLRALEHGGVVGRATTPDGPKYRLTDAGRELAPLVAALGVWGQRWLPRRLAAAELDIDPVLWDMRGRARAAALPERPTVLRIELTDLPPTRNRRFLLVRRTEISLCAHDRRTLIGWWRGDLSFAQAKRAGLAVTGPRRLVRELPAWFDRYAFAGVPTALATNS